MNLFDLLERRIDPGNVVGVKITKDDLNELRRKILQFQQNIEHFHPEDKPEELKAEFQDLLDTYRTAVSKYQGDLNTKKSEYEKKLERFGNGVRKNCSVFLQDYHRSRSEGAYAPLHVKTNMPFIYGKSPTPIGRVADKIFDKIQIAAGLGIHRSNSVPVYASHYSAAIAENNTTPYAIFPRDGFKYSWSKQSISYSDYDTFKLLDKEVIGKLHQMLKRYIAKSEENAERVNLAFDKVESNRVDFDKEPVRFDEYNGFMSDYYWREHVEAVELLINEGIVPSKFKKYADQYFIDPKKAKAYLHNYGFVENTGLADALSRGSTIYIQGEFYGVTHDVLYEMEKYINVS